MRIKSLIFASTFFFTFIFLGPVFADAEADSFSAAVKEIFDTYCATNMKNDTEGWLALWDGEGIKMSPNLPVLNGKSAIREFKLKRAQDNKNVDITMGIKIDDTQEAGDFGFAHGTFSVSVKPKGDGDTKFIAGKYLTIFKKQADGSWKIYRDSMSYNPASK